MTFRTANSRFRWVSDCGRFQIKRRMGHKGCFVHVYDCYDGKELFATRPYVTEAKRACAERVQ